MKILMSGMIICALVSGSLYAENQFLVADTLVARDTINSGKSLFSSDDKEIEVSKAESTTFISEQRFLFNVITNGMYEFIKQFGLYDKQFMLCNAQLRHNRETVNGFPESGTKKTLIWE